MDLSEIREELKVKHGLDADEIKAFAKEVSERELTELHHKKSGLAKITTSIYYSLFFILFAIVVIGFSIYAIGLKNETVFGKTLPWIVLFGGVLLVIKHLINVINIRK